MIKRITALLLVMFVMIGMSMSAGTAATTDETKVYKIKLAFASPPTHPWTIAANAMAENVKQKTNNKVQITVYDSGKLGTLPETTESVLNGSIEMALMATMTMSSFVPEIQILDFPYLFPTASIAETILDGELGDRLRAPIEAAGFYCPYFLDNDFRCISNNKRPMLAPSDLKGVKLRIPETPVLSAWVESMGGIPTIIPASETYSSVQSGVADGQENGVLLTMTNKYYEVVKYFTDTNHIYGAAVIIFNNDFWNSLPDEYKRVLDEECMILRDNSRSMIADERDTYLEEMRKTVEVTILTPEQLQVWVDSARPLYGQFRDKIDSQLLDAITAEVDLLLGGANN